MHEFVMQSYLKVMAEIVNQMERDSLEMSGAELEAQNDTIITVRAHMVYTKNILAAFKGVQ